MNKEWWLSLAKTGRDRTEAIISEVLLARRPVILFGASGMLSFILDNLSACGIRPEYICDNAPEKEGIIVKGIEVISFAKLLKLDKEYSILLSVNSANVRTAIKAQLAESGRFSYVYDAELFYPIGKPARNLILKNKRKIEKCYNLLEDEMSKEIFDKKLKYCVEKERDSLVSLEEKNIYFPKDIFSFSEEEVFLDAGAYNGDDTANLIKHAGKIDAAYIFEPEHTNAEQIRKRFMDNPSVEVFEAGLARKSGTLYFSDNGQNMMGGKIEKHGDHAIKGVALDSHSFSKKITYLKMDIEGGEIDAIKGMKRLLKSKENAPEKLAISGYHAIGHHFQIPLLIKKYNPNYKFYYRHYGPGGCDTVLYCVLAKSH